MELNEIEYFLALASCGNISKAAEQLYMSQSALSQFLTKTEGRLGTKLFHRNRSGLTLTDAGQIYFEAASRINEIQTQALQSIDYQTRTVQGTLRLGISSFRSIEYTAALLPHLNKVFPNKDIEFKQGSVSSLCRDLANRTIDFAFMALGDTSSDFMRITLSSEELVLAVSRAGNFEFRENFSRLHETPTDIKNFQNMKFILHSKPSEMRTICDSYFNKTGFFPTIFAQVDDFLTAYEILQSYPVAYVASMGYVRRLSNCDIYRLIDAPSYELGLVYPHDSSRSSFTKEFLSLIKNLEIPY